MSIRIDGEELRREVDGRLQLMEAQLREMYAKAAEEVERKARAHLKEFQRMDAEMKKALGDDRKAEKKYRAWRKAELTRGRKYKELKKMFTKRMATVNQEALAYINGELPEVFSFSYNTLGTEIVGEVDKAVNAGISFSLVDADTVRVLASEDGELLPYKELDIPADMRWNTNKMRAELLQGALVGDDVPTMAKRLQRVTGMNEAAAVRNARTMVNGAENRGRDEGMRRAEKDGIHLVRRWIAAHDKRTRDLHLLLDGQERAVGEPFEVDMYTINYPGDPSAAPEMVYNCRCTLGAVVTGFTNPVTGKTVMVKR